MTATASPSSWRFSWLETRAIAAGLAFVAERVDVRPVAQRAFAVAVALLLAATAAVAFSRYGGPVTLADRGYTAFKAPAAPAVGR